VPSAADQISAAIVAAGGVISFNQFMQLALYGDAGFYTTSGQAGSHGQDLTTKRFIEQRRISLDKNLCV
jgi:SAM-dependent MidA family methyltransferase